MAEATGMKVAVMQPYFFPYLGYFQLIRAVDAFVVFDDVSFIKRGWISRNAILGGGVAQRLTLDTSGASQNRLISEVGVGANRDKLLKTIRQNYAQAPQFGAAYPVIEEALALPEANLARFLERGLQLVCGYLGLQPGWHCSSGMEKEAGLRGQDKVLALCEALGASHYINLPGGQALYDRAEFARRGITLSFIRPRPIAYRQLGGPFVPNLSIIDVMMFNDREQCANLLQEYDLA